MSSVMLKPNFVKVKELETATNGFSLYAKVVKVQRKQLKRDNKIINAVEAVLGDQTGIVNGFFKGDAANQIKVGRNIAVRNGFKRIIKKYLVISIDDFGRITSQENKDIKVNEQNNISAIEREEPKYQRRQRKNKYDNRRNRRQPEQYIKNNRQNYRDRNQYKQQKDHYYSRYNNQRRNYPNQQKNYGQVRNYNYRQQKRYDYPRNSYYQNYQISYDNNQSFAYNPMYNQDIYLSSQSRNYFYPTDSRRNPIYNDQKNKEYNYYQTNNSSYNRQYFEERTKITNNINKTDDFDFDRARIAFQQKPFVEKEGNKIEWKKIKDIDPGEEEINLKVKILQLRFVDAAKKKVKCQVGDQTGVSEALLQSKDFVQKGATVTLQNVQANVVNEHIELNVFGKMNLSSLSIIQINTSFNLSQKAWVPSKGI